MATGNIPDILDMALGVTADGEVYLVSMKDPTWVIAVSKKRRRRK